MNINLTLFAQAVSFTAFIWFTVKFVWPFMLRAIETRQKTIADGLAAAEHGAGAGRPLLKRPDRGPFRDPRPASRMAASFARRRRDYLLAAASCLATTCERIFEYWALVSTFFETS